jgi:hypothetical protein
MSPELDAALARLLSSMTPAGQETLRSIVRKLIDYAIDHAIDREQDEGRRRVGELSAAVRAAGLEIASGLREIARAVRESRPKEGA